MSPLLTVLLAIIWIAIAFWPARVAGRKGHSFFGYFVFSLVFFPLALLMAYMVQDRTARERLSFTREGCSASPRLSALQHGQTSGARLSLTS